MAERVWAVQANSTLASARPVSHTFAMKTATVQQVPQQWAQIMSWIAAGEEVQVTEQDKVLARLVPWAGVHSPDFLARAKAVWGDAPAGLPLSVVVSDARGGQS